MSVLRYALVADGPSDRVLSRVIEWAIAEWGPELRVGEPAFLPRTGALREAIQTALNDYEPDVLFVHRDAERETLTKRLEEIPVLTARQVPIVPVRMTEAWLLIDEHAIREAVGNPHGRDALNLPQTRKLDEVPDPKNLLREALRTARGQVGKRRRSRFERDLASLTHRVGDLIEDFSPLRALGAFASFEAALHAALADYSRSTDPS